MNDRNEVQVAIADMDGEYPVGLPEMAEKDAECFLCQEMDRYRVTRKRIKSEYVESLIFPDSTFGTPLYLIDVPRSSII